METAARGGPDGGGNRSTSISIISPSADGENPPAELTRLPRWITWRHLDGKKVPTDRDGRSMDGNDPANWATYEDVRRRAPKDGGIGFAFSEDDNLGGVDLDACRDPVTGELTTWAQAIIDDFGSYTEVSPSKTGVKIFALGAMKKLPAKVIPMPGEPIKGKAPQAEGFVGTGYFTVTGQRHPGTPAEVREASGAWLRLHKRLTEVAESSSGGSRPAAGRNDCLHSMGSSMRAKGFPDPAIRAAIVETNRAADPEVNPNFAGGPLPDREVDTILRSVLRYPPGTAMSNPGEVTRTDVGNAERLRDRHGADLLYCYAWKTWLVYDGKRFRMDGRGEVVRRAKETAVAIYAEAAAVAPRSDDLANALAKHAAATQQRQRLEAMIALTQSELPIQVEDLDRDDGLLNLENGTLDLRTLTLRDHRREDRLTKLAPVALDGNAGCPTWMAFVDRVFGGDLELIAFMQRAVGYTLTGNVGEHVFFLLYGTGANGKTTLINTLAAMLGDYAKTVRVEALLASERSRTGAPNEDVANLFGVRLASTSEPDEQFRLNEALIKALTGGDTISARRLNEQLFEFRPSHKIWLAANHKPEIRGVDEGIWRRVMFVPFEVTIPPEERDHDLPDKLKAELPGILNWAVDGLRAYHDQGGLKPPERVQAATAEYREEQDILADFIKAECVIGEGMHAITADLTRAYERFTGTEAVRPQTFARLLKARGFRRGLKKVTGRTQRVWLGLGLAHPEAEEPNPGEADLIPF